MNGWIKDFFFHLRALLLITSVNLSLHIYIQLMIANIYKFKAMCVIVHFCIEIPLAYSFNECAACVCLNEIVRAVNYATGGRVYRDRHTYWILFTRGSKQKKINVLFAICVCTKARSTLLAAWRIGRVSLKSAYASHQFWFGTNRHSRRRVDK